MTETETPEQEAGPIDEQREALLGELKHKLGDAIVDSEIAVGRCLWIRVANEAWASTARTLRDDLGAKHFGFLSTIDWMPSPFGRYLETEADTLAKAREFVPPSEWTTGVAGGTTRFQIFARVTNLAEGWSVIVKADTSDDENPTIETWTGVYAGADWHEREAWEMFGVTFTGHPGLRHMYLPGGFEGNPMRKDYPLLARLVKPWPGIVDVEPMPGESDDAAAGEGEPTS